VSSRRRTEPVGLAAVLGSCAALVLLSAAWKGVCVDPSRDFRLTCYSDVLEMFSSRGLADPSLPYVGGRLVDGAPVDTFEYPVLTGLFVWLSALLPGDTRASFLLVSTLLLLPFALLTAWHLQRMAGARALRWAAAPALVLYALHNWDLLVVAAATAGLHAWWRGRHAWAAVLLATGACLKVYPGLFVLVLVVERLVHRDRSGASTALAAGALTVVAVNLPFVLADPSGWATTYVFQEARAADGSSGSLWFWVWPHATTDQLNRLVPALLLAALAGAVAHGMVRARREGAFPLLQVCGAVLVAFLLLNKVSSPQYVLWLLPFLAVVRVHLAWWVAYALVDVVIYVGVFRWLHALETGADPSLPGAALEAGVWVRSALLAALFVVLLRADDALVAQPTQRPEVKPSTSSTMSGAASTT